MSLPARFACVGCGATIYDETTPPFRCPAQKRGDNVDHVLARSLDSERVAFPPPEDTPSENPFLIYRDLFHARHLARAHGLADGVVDELVGRLDDPDPDASALEPALALDAPA